MNIPVIRELAKQARKVLDSTASDEVKYDQIFSWDIAGKVRLFGLTLDYCDPDSSYIEDARAYVEALEAKVVEFGNL